MYSISFNIKRIQIQELYNEQIDALKTARKNEVKIMKKDFSERREVIMKKYLGKMRKKTQKKITEPTKNEPEKIKVPKDKKRI